MSRPTLYWAKVVTLDGLRRSALNQARHFIRDPMRRVSAPLRSVQSNGPPDHLDPRPTRCFTLDLTGPCPGPTRLSTWTRAGTIPAPRQRLCPCIPAEPSSCTTPNFIDFHTIQDSRANLAAGWASVQADIYICPALQSSRSVYLSGVNLPLR